MGKPIPFDLRVKIVRDHESGMSHQSIAESLGFSRAGVKKLLRQYRERGDSALKADYSRCGKTPRRCFSDEVEAEIERRRSGLAGAPYLHSVLREQCPWQRVPSVSAIQLRWRRAGGRPGMAKEPRRVANTWTKEVHHTWQIDGKEQVPLGNGQQVSWGNIADEASSTVLYSGVFPPHEDGPSAGMGDVPSGQPLF